jgi:hypothetical protein
MKRIEIHIEGNISEKWAEWFGGLTITHPAPTETIIAGAVKDEAALYGLIARLRDLGLNLTSLHSEEIQADADEHR